MEEHVELKEFTTFKIGGRARYFCRVSSTAELKEAVEFSKKNRLPLFVLGGGSNVLISDKGFKGLVIKIDILGIEFIESRSTVLVVAGAGEVWDELVALCVSKGLHGMENLSGIPGTVGGAPVQNIGAYGVEISSILKWVEVFDPRTRIVRTLSRRECHFSYRDSVFKKKEKELIITKVAFTLSTQAPVTTAYKDVKDYFAKKKNPRPSVEDVRDAVLAIRKDKFPDLTQVGTAGSFFKNPIVTTKEYNRIKKAYPDVPAFPLGRGRVKLSLAWIIDHACKLKGRGIGDASVSKKQALVICNNGSASAREVRQLAEQIKNIVGESVGIEIEREVQYIGT